MALLQIRHARGRRRVISPGTPCIISGRDAVFPLTLCWAFRSFVQRGISMQHILIPSVNRTFAIPAAALIPLVPPNAETRLRRARELGRGAS